MLLPARLTCVLPLALCALAQLPASGQEALEPEDYGKFERLGGGELAPGGDTFAYTVSRVDGTSTLYVRRIADETPLEIDEGRGPVFSEDSRWLAYAIGLSEDDREKRTESKQPIRNKLGLLDLSRPDLIPDAPAEDAEESEDSTDSEESEVSEDSGDSGAEIVEDVASFAFSDDGRFLALRGYPPKAAAPPKDEEQGDRPKPRFHLVVRDLARGVDTAFGNVTEYAWSDVGGLLAMVVRPDTKAGQGVQLFDPSSGVLRTLDSGKAEYRGLRWREDGYDLAVLRVHADEGFEDPTHHILAWRGLEDTEADTLAYVPGDDAEFPEGMRIVDFRGLSWSDDAQRIFFGLKEWKEKEIEPEEEDEAETSESEEVDDDPDQDPGEAPEEAPEEASDEDEEEPSEPDVKPADVDVWHSGDRRINPMQKKSLQRDKQKNFLAVWDLEANRVLRLSHDADDPVRILRGERFVIETDSDPYERGHMFGREWNDLYRIDTRTGERTKILERVRYFLGGSATGRTIVYLQDDQLRTFDLESGAEVCLTCELPSSFVDREHDFPVEQKPPYGIAGWLEDDEAVLFYDEFDVWRAAPDGSGAARITDGAARELEFRFRQLDPEAEWIDPEQPLHYALTGKWTKQSGFARGSASGDAGDAKELVLDDRRIGRLTRAKHADVFAWSSEAFDDSPDYFVAGPDSVAGSGFDDARAVSETNAFLGDYAWGRTELIEYEDAQGTRLQGTLAYPADFVAGEQYPMIVYVYEKLSQGVHRFVSPSNRSPYNTAVFTTQGYFVLQPDIVFQPREPGVSALDCVTAAVNTVLERGHVDADRIGLVGHSWGGYEATYLPTRTNLFAASVAGAPLTNFLSFMGQIHWNAGMPELSHWETGQARMDVPYWEDFEAHVRNSPATFIEDLDTPLLMTFGKVDGTVDWHQGVEFYNFARRAGKFMVLLVYDGENHGLRKKHNQIDYQHRVLHWFDHFLKGVPAEPWITEGVPHLEREEVRAKQKQEKRARGKRDE